MIEPPSPGASAGFLALIAIGIAIAVAAGSNLAIAIPAGASAVVLTMVLGLYSVLAARREERGPRRVPDSRPVLGIQRALAGDRFQREEIVLLLDHLERSGPNPTMPSRPRNEIAAIVSMKGSEFRGYVAGRVDRLERES